VVSRQRFSESRWGGPGTGLVAILAGAAALRLVGLKYGLPFGLLDRDEPELVPRAWRIVHDGGADPHWFRYPSFLLYLLAPFQAWMGAPSYLAARIVVLVLGLGAVAASWWLGRRAYGVAAGAVAAAVVAIETTHVAYSRIVAPDVPLTLAIAVALALLVGGRVELGAAVAGLATAIAYPGVFLLAPLVAAAWGRWRQLAISVAIGIVVFCAATPFVLVDLGRAADDGWNAARHARIGALGFEHGHFALFAFVARLWDGLGPALLVAAIGLVAALVRRRRADLVLASFVLVYFADLLTLRAHFERSVLPLVPPLAALAGRFRSLAAVTLMLLVVPLVWAVRADQKLTREDTRVAAHDWVERHVPRGTKLVADTGLPPFPGYRVIRLRLPGPGRSFDRHRLLPNLRQHGTATVVVNGAIADKILAARDRYPREARFYERLKTATLRAFYARPGRRRSGPWVAVYRL
jgi:4-amino-4-deoxy-L-arabinose transferase-like glycosyltransferase